MAYNPNVPAGPSENPSVTEPNLRSNFQTLNTYTAVNHVPLNDPNQGKHTLVEMQEEAADPATLANEGTLYTKDIAGITQLFYRADTSGLVSQMTGAFTPGVTDGEFILPGGLIVKWGFRTTIVGTATIVFPTPFPTNIFTAQISQARDNSTSRVMYIQKSGGLALTGITVRSTSGGGSGAYFIAIGN